MKISFPRFKWRLQFSLLTLFGVTTAVAVFFGIVPAIRTQLAVRALSNNEVDVDGTYFGLKAEIRSPAAEELKRLGSRANWALEQAIADPEKFAAAHVLLTEISQTSYSISGSHWNEMEIDLHADGRVDFHAEQIPKLQEYWRNRLRKNRPTAE